MNKKIKIGLLVFVLSLFVGVSYAHATSPALNWSSDTAILIGGNRYIIASGSSATSLVVNSNNIVVLVPVGSTFAFQSPNGYPLNNTDGSISSPQVCDPTNQVFLTITGTGSTFTITPDSSKTCFVSGGGGQLSSSGGGSSSTPPPTIIPNPPTTPTPPANVAPVSIPGCMSNTGFSITTGQSCTGNTVIAPNTPATPPNTPSSSVSSGSSSNTYNFGTKILKLGSKGEAVKELQRFLNQSLSLKLSADGNFGQGTLLAVKKWQKAHELKADGVVGPGTKAKMNASLQ